MRRLIAIGDHWTAGKGIESDDKYKNIEPDLFVKAERLNNAWPRWLAEKFNIPFINLGNETHDGNKIRVTTKQALLSCSREDLIVIMWGHPYKHLQRPVAAGVTLDLLMQDMIQTLEGYDYYFCNAYHPIFREEEALKPTLRLHRFIDVDSSAADIISAAGKESDRKVWNYDDTNVDGDTWNILQGKHCPNLTGQKIIADWLYKKIMKIE